MEALDHEARELLAELELLADAHGFGYSIIRLPGDPQIVRALGRWNCVVTHGRLLYDSAGCKLVVRGPTRAYVVRLAIEAAKQAATAYQEAEEQGLVDEEEA